MPIKPENRALYPPNWDAISLAIRFERAQGQCECSGHCGLHHARRCIEQHGQPAIFARGTVVLTVAHLNHEPGDCREENLLACCQRCHLRIDNEHHMKSAAATRRSRLNNLEMFS